MRRIIRRTFTSLAVCAAVAGTPAAALAWAPATHAYIARHTNKMGGIVTDAEMCRRILGANGPDLFNALFEDPTAQALAAVLHRPDDAAPNLAPYHAAQDPLQRSYGFGFASHNNVWGTDSIAHYHGMTFGRDVGYVNAKAVVVGNLLYPLIQPYFPDLPAAVVQALAIQVSGDFVELAIDFLLSDADPSLGAALQASAGCYLGQADNDFLLLALGGYFGPVLSNDPATGEALAKAYIDAVEPQFVQGLGVNGYALARHDAVGRQIIVDATVAQGKALLASQGIPPPPDAVLAFLVDGGISLAQLVCAPDFMDEIEATIGRVNGEMSSRDITPASP